MTAMSFTASRAGFPPGDAVPGVVVNVLHQMPHYDRYVTGGCIGGDAWIGLWLAINRPDAAHWVICPADRSRVDPWWNETPGLPEITVIHMAAGTRYADRNLRLVAEGDGLTGFPAWEENDTRSQRSGTWQTLRMARRAHKPLQWHCVTPPYRGWISPGMEDMVRQAWKMPS